jgi:hypothetical protein
VDEYHSVGLSLKDNDIVALVRVHGYNLSVIGGLVKDLNLDIYHTGKFVEAGHML